MNELTKILYVEDEESIQKIARLALEAVAGFELRISSSGEEALKEAENYSADLVMLDVMMPGMDGIQTIAELKKLKQYQNTPFLFMTGKTNQKEIDKLNELGGLGVIKKPFKPMDLGSEIRELWKNK